MQVLRKLTIEQLVITHDGSRYKISVQDARSVVETIFCDDLPDGIKIVQTYHEFSPVPTIPE